MITYDRPDATEALTGTAAEGCCCVADVTAIADDTRRLERQSCSAAPVVAPTVSPVAARRQGASPASNGCGYRWTRPIQQRADSGWFEVCSAQCTSRSEVGIGGKDVLDVGAVAAGPHGWPPQASADRWELSGRTAHDLAGPERHALSGLGKAWATRLQLGDDDLCLHLATWDCRLAASGSYEAINYGLTDILSPRHPRSRVELHRPQRRTARRRAAHLPLTPASSPTAYAWLRPPV